MNPGTQVGYKYKIQSRLGKGSFGSVYKAVNTISGQTVAVKIVLKTDTSGILQLQNESKIMHLISKTKKDCISPRLHGFTSDQIYKCLVMECAVASLADIDSLNPLRISGSTELLGALKVLHSHRVIHRDIKPSNILVLSTGKYVLTDFGLSGPPITEPSTVSALVGTPKYASQRVTRLEQPSYIDDVESLMYVLLYISSPGILVNMSSTAFSEYSPAEDRCNIELALAVTYCRDMKEGRVSYLYLRKILEALDIRQRLILR